MNKVTIYHNPQCGTSRNTLALIREAGIEPEIILYLQTPPSREQLQKIMRDAGLTARQIMRDKGDLYVSLNLADAKWSDDELLDFMMKHPELINRPIVMTERGTALCRPAEKVLDILPAQQ